LEHSLKNLTAKIVKRKKKKKPMVLLTRPERQVEPVKSQLEALGFQVLLQPAIDILPPESWREIDESIQKLRNGKFDWLIFSSSNGVHSFFDHLGQTSVPNVQIAVVGSSTNETLYQRMGRNADIVPEIFTAEGVAVALHAEATQGKRFLHLRASRGRDTLRQLLTESGGNVTEIAAYRSVDRIPADPQIAELLQRGSIDYVTVTSSAIARSLTAMFGELLRQTRLVSISPVTSKTLCDLGFPPQVEANEASLAGIVDVLRTLITP
jgi:uroporphyrinogen III methyltransferase/synthase